MPGPVYFTDEAREVAKLEPAIKLKTARSAWNGIYGESLIGRPLDFWRGKTRRSSCTTRRSDACVVPTGHLAFNFTSSYGAENG